MLLLVGAGWLWVSRLLLAGRDAAALWLLVGLGAASTLLVAAGVLA